MSGQISALLRRLEIEAVDTSEYGCRIVHPRVTNQLEHVHQERGLPRYTSICWTWSDNLTGCCDSGFSSLLVISITRLKAIMPLDCLSEAP